MKVDYIKLVDLFPRELDAQFSKLYLPPHNAVRIVISQNKQILSVSKLKHFQRRALQLLSCDPQSRCPHIPRVCSGSPYVPVDFSRCASYGFAFLTLTEQCNSEEDEVAPSCPQCEADYLYTEFCRMICAESPVRWSQMAQSAGCWVWVSSSQKRLSFREVLADFGWRKTLPMIITFALQGPKHRVSRRTYDTRVDGRPLDWKAFDGHRFHPPGEQSNVCFDVHMYASRFPFSRRH